MRKKIKAAPKLAANTNKLLPLISRLANPQIAPLPPNTNINRATPKLAPELIPNTEGPASGFRNKVCICNPPTDKPAPTRIAVMALGSRIFWMMFRSTLGADSDPHKEAQTSPKAIWTEPNKRSRIKKIKSKINKARIRPHFGPNPGQVLESVLLIWTAKERKMRL